MDGRMVKPRTAITYRHYHGALFDFDFDTDGQNRLMPMGMEDCIIDGFNLGQSAGRFSTFGKAPPAHDLRDCGHKIAQDREIAGIAGYRDFDRK